MMTSEEPPYRIRKYADGWRLNKLVDFNGIKVWSFIGVFRSHQVALAIMDVDAGPDSYPLFNELKEY
jgi:hypothetical protein